VAGFGFFAPSKNCRFPRYHSELPIQRDRFTRAKYVEFGQRNVKCVTH